jgi:hypothetical protein
MAHNSPTVAGASVSRLPPTVIQPITSDESSAT